MFAGMWQLEAKTLRLEVSHAALQLIAEIDEFKGKWEALRTLSPDRLLASSGSPVPIRTRSRCACGS